MKMINLQQAIDNANTSHTKLAKAIGLTQPAVTNIVKVGTTNIKTAILISKHLNVSLDYLCGLNKPADDKNINKIIKIKNILKG